MRIKVNRNDVSLSERDLNTIEKNLQKIEKLLPNIKDGMVNLSIRKSKKKIYPKKRHQRYKEYLNRKLKESKYEGWVMLILPKKPVYAHFYAVSVKQGITKVIRAFLKEVKRYKEMHFKSLSKYPDHRSIRSI